MTQATHTPGPWAASLAEWHNGAPWLIGAPVSEYLPAEAERHIGNAYKEANARLIAAAPDLLAALEILQAAIDADGVPVGWGIVADKARNAIAIAKATGKE